MKQNSRGKPVREWDGEALSGSAGTVGDFVEFSGAYPAQTGFYIKNCDSAGILYCGVGLSGGADDLSSLFPGIDLGPGDWKEVPAGSEQTIYLKASSGTISYCIQRFSE